jgi:hypothetical protein
MDFFTAVLKFFIQHVKLKEETNLPRVSIELLCQGNLPGGFGLMIITSFTF